MISTNINQQLQRMLLGVLDDEHDLSHIAVQKLGLNRKVLGEGSFGKQVAQLIAHAAQENQLDHLIRIVETMRTASVMDKDHPFVSVDPGASLGHPEDIPGVVGTVKDVAAWYDKLQKMKKCICKIKVGSVPGTGFLVAPNVVLTSYHMVGDFIRNNMQSTAITVSFDFKPRRSDTIPPAGEPHKLRRYWPDWCISYGQDSAADDGPEAAGKAPGRDELDYVLLRLEDRPGDERGYIRIPTDEPAIPLDSPLCILQYPSDRRLKIAFSSHGAQHLNDGGTRLRHKVNTDDGSYGSPVFNEDWTLVALHRGYVKPPPGGKVELNDAIPIARIRDHFFRNTNVDKSVRADLKLSWR